MIGDKARSIENLRSIIDHSPAWNKEARALITFDLKPLYPNIYLDYSEPKFYTNGLYHLRYKPSCNKDKKYLIVTDLMRSSIRVRNYDDLLLVARNSPMVKFIVEYTTISRDLFRIAGTNVNISIGFALDYVKYERDLRAKQKWNATLVDPIYNIRDWEMMKSDIEGMVEE